MVKLTEVPPPERSRLDRCSVPPERIEREKWFARLAWMVADTVEAAQDGTIDREERDAVIADMKLSQQDIGRRKIT